jgi:polyisoprenoid-binding protein YceI
MDFMENEQKQTEVTTAIHKERKMRKTLILPSLALVSLLTMAAANGTPKGEEHARELRMWNIDTPHTEINFTVKHFFTPVTGTFRTYDVDLMFDAEAPENSSVKVSIDVASVDTNNERRDNHLRSADFFDAEKYPKMTFESTSIRRAGPNQLLAKGNLTIKETTREVDLAINLLGVMDLPPEMQEMLGGVTQVASFEATTKVDRREFEVGVANWAQTMIVGGDVDISIALEANHK